MGLRKLGFILPASLAATAALVAAAPQAARAQQSAFAIAGGGTTLISFETNNPGAATAVGNFSLNGVATFLDAIDFRPLDGQLYGYLDDTDTLYTVNTATGALTAVASGTGASATNTNLLGMDFNPTIDRVRVVTDSTQNLVYNPNTNAAPMVTTPLFYPAGDPGASSARGPLVIESAYSNNIAGLFGTATIQYGIDYGTDTLVTIANNAGTLATIGSLGISINDTAPFVGFDIFTSLAGANTAYAALDTTATGAAPIFYTINLQTGAASSMGSIGGGRFSQVYSLAVRPADTSVIPEPGTGALALVGVLALAGGIVRRRAR